MTLTSLKENWLRPFFFYRNNPFSVIGAALTTASALVLISFWIVGILSHGVLSNPYFGIIFELCLPVLFVLGLVLIPVGIWFRRRSLKRAGKAPAVYPKIDLSDPTFRHGLDLVLIATIVNFFIVGTATYRGVAYMDRPNFCGQTCHVMTPEWKAYPVYSHVDVACTQCHIPSGITSFVHAKLNGTRQVLHVALNDYARPIMAGDKLPPASATCLKCHNPDAYVGDRLLVSTSFGDDEKNSTTKSLIMMHVGGRDQFGELSGIHGAHLGHIEYIATDSTHQTIPWIGKTNADGSVTEYLTTDAKGPVTGQKRAMDCIDCHNRAAHSFDSPENALNKDMARGTPSPSLPFIHKEGIALLKGAYTSQEDAESKIELELSNYYQKQYPSVWTGQRQLIDQAARTLTTIYSRNVFPVMNVTWGTHPNNIGHNTYPGCFRCHDGNHNAKNEKTINNDCSTCHNLLAVDDPNPKQLSDLGFQ